MVFDPDDFKVRHCVLGRWYRRLDGLDATKAPRLAWARPPVANMISDLNFPGREERFYQFIPCASILESVSIISIPNVAIPFHPRWVFRDDGNINDDNRTMWVHLIGRSALGE